VLFFFLAFHLTFFFSKVIIHPSLPAPAEDADDATIDAVRLAVQTTVTFRIMMTCCALALSPFRLL
jgi:hypothetical protein